TFNKIVDGTSNTLMVGEARVHLGYLDGGGGCSDNESAYNSGWADDVVRHGNNTPPQPDVRDVAIPSGNVDGHFGSSHVGGMNAVLADGSVRFIRFSVNPTVFGYLCQIDGGKFFSPDNL